MRVLVMAALAGCSFGTSGAPSRYDGRVAPKCTTSTSLPSLDVGVAIVAGALSIPLLLVDEDDDCGGQEDCRHVGEDISHGFGKVLIGVGVIYAISSVIGFNNVSSCRAAVRKYEAVRVQQLPARTQ
jgi:hypothetical protein